MNKLLRGSFAGFAGTGLMTVVMAAERQAHLFRRPAPAEVTEQAEKKLNLRQHLSEPAFQASWLGAHFGFGISFGAGYALVRPLLPDSPILAGLIWGGGIWATSYLGVLPALGLHPSPDDDSRSRTAVMIATHAIYGITTAIVERRLAPRK
ncbi:MAG: DUF6789 family protein [Dehalococcoidia bacterium]